MGFGDTRIERIEDVAGWLSSIRGRVRILGARMRMHLTEMDVAEMEGIYDDCDQILNTLIAMRSQFSDDYLLRIGKR